MSSQQSRRILHIDMDAFFAAVEQKRKPELIGKAIFIGGTGDPTRRGALSTASCEARVFGIHSAMPLKMAYRLNPQAVFLPVDYEIYAAESHKVKKILQEIFPIMEDVGIDEAFLDITAVNRSGREIVREIKDRIREATGLTCSIGIGPNKLLAKMASDMQKPDGYTRIHLEDVERVIWPLPVRKLWGVGPKTEAQLKKIGVDTIGKLAALSPGFFVKTFGKSYGAFLYEASRGIDNNPLVTHWEPRFMSRETAFQRDIVNWQAIAKNLAELIKEVVVNLKEGTFRAKTITVKIRFLDFATLSRSMTLSVGSDSESKIRKAAFACLKRFDLNRPIRLIGIRLTHLEKTPVQED